MNPLWLFREAKLSKKERELLAGYSCRKARCFLPKDRATVLAAIREKWGSEEAFDSFVRKEFPGLLRRGKERFMRRPGEVCGGGVFGARCVVVVHLVLGAGGAGAWAAMPQLERQCE